MAGESAREAARRMREKSERIARAAENWERGAHGEERTAGVLGRLPSSEWTVFNDVRWPGRPRANIDHVVVGPPGVFVIDSKNWNGRIEVRDGVLRQNRRRRDSAVEGATEAALAVAGLLSPVPSTLVAPVLCFVREEAVTGRAAAVMLCSTGNLSELLNTRPAVFDGSAREQVARVLEHRLAAAAVITPAAEPRPARARGRSHASRPAARRSRSGVRSTVVARLVGAAIGLGIVGAALWSPLPQMVGNAVVDLVEPTDVRHEEPERPNRRGDRERSERP